MRSHALLAAAFLASLAGAYAWSQSKYADDYRANQIAIEEARKLGIPPKYEAKRPKKKTKDECSFVERAATYFVVI